MDEKKISKEDLVNELGVSGTQIVGGFIEEDYRSDLQGVEGCSTYDQMRKSDAQVFATLLAMELPIRQTDWYIDPGKNEDGSIDKKSQEVADFVNRNLFEALEGTFDDLLRQVLTMLPFGYSVFEKVYSVKDGKVYLKKLGYRKQTSVYKWQTKEGKEGICQRSISADDATETSKRDVEISIPMEKLLLFSFRQEGLNYEGVSILRSAYKHWYIKDKLYKFDAVRHERQSVGIPVIYLPKQANDKDKAEAQRIVRNVRSTEQTGIVMPGPKEDGRLFEFADTRAGTTTNLFESIKHHNREISKNILAQFLELGDTASGSRSLSEDQSDLFLLSLGAIAKQIADTFNKKLIPQLVDLNFNIGDQYYPQLKFQKLGNVDYSAMVANLTSLAGNGLLTVDENLEDFIRDSLELPARMISKETKEDSKKEEDAFKKEQKEIVDEKLKEKQDEDFGENTIFNGRYFQELSDLIDKNFIVKLHTNETL